MAALLDKIKLPQDLRQLQKSQLPQLATELRSELIETVSQTGGHLGSSLGVVELTVALHYVLDTPYDRLIWDVGHQSYCHKILTGRRGKMKTLRTKGGLSGFTKRSESVYDPFGAAHSSTSISAALGMATAAALQDPPPMGDQAGDQPSPSASQHQGGSQADKAPPTGEQPTPQAGDQATKAGDQAGETHRRRVAAVIGDGAMSAGLAFEAINNAGALKLPLIVVLNDNDMSIAPPTGAMSAYLSRLLSGNIYMGLRKMAAKRFAFLPQRLKRIAARSEEFAKGMVAGGTLFEELGFYYVGPIDGHDLKNLVPILENIKDYEFPVMLHVVTKKGYGYKPAEQSADKFHGVGKFDPKSGKPLGAKTPPAKAGDRGAEAGAKGAGAGAKGADAKGQPTKPTFTDVFASSLIAQAQKDKKVVAITAAMPDGTGLVKFAQKFPDRMFDVGIAEQHAVTFAAGLAAEGMKPFVAIYSTFLQRALDQVIHDVAVQNLPVRFAVDRAGLVGADGETHGGVFDLAFLGSVPNITVCSPADEAELARAVATATAFNQGPFVFRYPRGSGIGKKIPANPTKLAIGKGRVLWGNADGWTAEEAKGNTGSNTSGDIGGNPSSDLGGNPSSNKAGIAPRDIAIVALGSIVYEALATVNMLNPTHRQRLTVVDARFLKPLDRSLITRIAKSHRWLITLEEASGGSFGSRVAAMLSGEGLLHKGFRTLTLPDRFIPHGTPLEQAQMARLSRVDIHRYLLDILKAST